MKPTFLIQTNGINVFNVKESWEAAKKYGHVEEAVVIPFDDTLDNDFDSRGKFVIPFGSVRLQRIGIKEGWDGVFFNDNFSMSKYMDNSDDMLNSDGMIIRIKDLENKTIEKQLPQKLFIKPNKDNKSFLAFESNGLDQEIFRFLDNAEMQDNANYDMDTEILVTSSKEIVSEYRYFIVGGKVVTGSLYFLNGRQISINIDDDDENMKDIQKLADKWLPHETCVMDICLVKNENGGHDMKIVEFNSLNSSGFYDHDVDLLFKRLSEYYEN
jgi:hypothetical protein